MPIFKKKREPSPTPNGHAGNGQVNGELSITALQREINSIHSRLKLLTQDREQLALPSLRGDTEATARLAEIDAERQALALRKETLESAVRSLHAEQRQSDWRSRIPHMQRIRATRMLETWDAAATTINQLLLSHQAHDTDQLRRILDDVEAQERQRELARTAADECLPHPQVWFTPGDPQEMARARAEKERRMQERAKVIEDAANELLSTPIKRPRRVEEALARAHQRIAAAPDKLQGLGKSMDGPIMRDPRR